jgi:hypothetical protein
LYMLLHMLLRRVNLDTFNDLKDELIIDSGGFTTIKQEIFAGAFGQDVNPTEADIMTVAQSHLINQYLPKSLALLHGGSFQHGIKYQRMTTRFLLIYNVCSQSRWMQLQSHFPQAMRLIYPIQMRLHN